MALVIQPSEWERVRALLARLDAGTAPGGAGGGASDAGLIRIRNDSAAPLKAGHVVKYAGLVHTPEEYPENWRNHLAHKGEAPGDGDPFAVAMEDIPVGAEGYGANVGAVPVRVNLTDAGHRYAKPAGVTAHLVSSADGGVELVYKPSATGLVDCVALLPAGAGDAAPRLYRVGAVAADNTATATPWMLHGDTSASPNVTPDPDASHAIQAVVLSFP